MVRRFTSIQVYTAHIPQHKEITLPDIPSARYKLELFVGSEAMELLRNDNRSWAPVQRPYVLFSSQCTLSQAYVYVERFLRQPRSG